MLSINTNQCTKIPLRGMSPRVIEYCGFMLDTRRPAIFITNRNWLALGRWDGIEELFAVPDWFVAEVSVDLGRVNKVFENKPDNLNGLIHSSPHISVVHGDKTIPCVVVTMQKRR